MNNRAMIAAKVIPLIAFAVSLILLIISFCINDVPEKFSYTYKNSRIIAHSWHDTFLLVTSVIFVAIVVSLIISAAIQTVARLRNRESAGKITAHTVLCGIICTVMIFSSNVIVTGLWTDDDYDPVCYNFTDGTHTVVIEEKSFLLLGRGTVYQISDSGKAVIIGRFSTDNGVRNKGKYDIDWHESFADISYTYNSQNSQKAVVRVEFQ